MAEENTSSIYDKYRTGLSGIKNTLTIDTEHMNIRYKSSKFKQMFNLKLMSPLLSDDCTMFHHGRGEQ